ncbi:uncharacterized protein LOC119191695 [Manduca sexta]|uniref:uncharacterized protein LOC119191695 n=1 Tax=Manduca sexta TaxID=7130 RepID=UPI00118429DC|nr:uncharacterized protein LOC119191695 [Manduca sexta]
MWSVRDLGVAALVVIVVGHTAAQAFPVYETVANDMEFGPSSPIAARDGTQFWKHLMHPMFDRLRRTDGSESSNDFRENMLKPTTYFELVGTPPPADKKNVNKNNQGPPRMQRRELYVPEVTEPELFFKVYV